MKGPDTPTVHALKTWPEYYSATVASGKKTFEIRKNDRDFKTGDLLALLEYDFVHKIFTGRATLKLVTFIFYGNERSSFGLDDDHVVMATVDVSRLDPGPTSQGLS